MDQVLAFETNRGVPIGTVPELRVGLRRLLVQAAGDVSLVVGSPGMECRAEWYEEPLERFDRARALLDVVGWGATGPPVELKVDLASHEWALRAGLDAALLAGCEDIKESEPQRSRGRVGRDAEPRHEGTVQRVLALRQFISTVEERCDSALDAAR